MGLKDNSGTIRKVIIGGPTFRAMADIDVQHMLAQWTTEGQPTSGEPMYKMTRVMSEATGIDVAADMDEFVTISAAAESPLDIPLGFVTASGVTFMGAGRISLDPLSHANNKVTVKFMFTVPPVKIG